MGPIRMISILFMIATIVRSNMSTGSLEPNVDIITVLKQLTVKTAHLDKKIDAIALRMTRNEKQTKEDIEELRKEISSLRRKTTTPSPPTSVPTTTESTWIFYPPGNKLLTYY